MNNVNNWTNVNKLTLNFCKLNILLINPTGFDTKEVYFYPIIQIVAYLLNYQ